MAKTASVVAQKLVGLLAVGMDSAIPATNIFNQNVSFELSEKSQAVKYPVIYVYVDRVKNSLTEKFRKFSGTVRTTAEVRVSQDRIEGIEEQLRLYVDSVIRVLDANRGSWGDGAFYAGTYEVAIDPVRQGGRNFLQAAKVTLEVDLSC